MSESIKLTHAYASLCQAIGAQLRQLEQLCERYLSSLPPSAAQGLFFDLSEAGRSKKSVVASHGAFVTALVAITEQTDAQIVRLDALMQDADAQSDTALILRSGECMTQYAAFQASVDASLKQCDAVLSADEASLSLAALFRQIREIRIRSMRFDEFLATETDACSGSVQSIQ